MLGKPLAGDRGDEEEGEWPGTTSRREHGPGRGRAQAGPRETQDAGQQGTGDGHRGRGRLGSRTALCPRLRSPDPPGVKRSVTDSRAEEHHGHVLFFFLKRTSGDNMDRGAGRGSDGRSQQASLRVRSESDAGRGRAW